MWGQGASLTVPLSSEQQSRRGRKAPGLRERQEAKEGEGGEPTRGTAPRCRLGPDWPTCQHKRRGQKRRRRPEERAVLLILGGDWTAGRKCGEEGERRKGVWSGLLSRPRRLRPQKGGFSPPSPTKCRRGEGSGLLTHLSPPALKVLLKALGT